MRVREYWTAAKILKGLRMLCGYVENGSQEAVTISQDDATREWAVSVRGRPNKHVHDTDFKGALVTAIEELLPAEELAELKSSSDSSWRPISTAPMGASGKPETYFIGGRLDTDGRISTATCYRNSYGAYEWWGGGLRPTHWMPLPKLPEDNQ